jgi:hypothetical protein
MKWCHDGARWVDVDPEGSDRVHRAHLSSGDFNLFCSVPCQVGHNHGQDYVKPEHSSQAGC